DLDAAYRGKARFTPGLGTRATAAALQTAASIADRVGDELGVLSAHEAPDRTAGDVETWHHYVASVLDAVSYRRARRTTVVVVTQPYGSDMHVAQQKALAVALDRQFGSDKAVQYVNLGRLVDLRDRTIAYDGLHLVAPANRRVAEALVDPV